MRVVVTVVMLIVGFVGLLMSLCGGVTLVGAHDQPFMIAIALGSVAVGIVVLVMTFKVIRSVWSRDDRK